MSKEKIIQFVGFITPLEPELFIPKWKEYLHLQGPGHVPARLYRQEPESRSRFRYISQHEWPDESFDFIKKNGRRAEHFPEQQVRVVHAGGYLTISGHSRARELSGTLKLFAFISHNEPDIRFYLDLAPSAVCEVYQAYYESCTHGYIIEYAVNSHSLDVILPELKKRPGIEISLCRAGVNLQPARIAPEL